MKTKIFNNPLEDDLETGKAFISTKQEKKIHQDHIHILGIPFDGTVSFRPGARFGPDAIRNASDGIETYSPYQHSSLEESPIIDMGNLPFTPSDQQNIFNNFRLLTENIHLKRDNVKFLMLGGEHSISYPLLKKYLNDFQQLTIIHLDAHTDLRESYLDNKHSHACIMKRAFDLLSSEQKILQYGIRSGTKEEFEFSRKRNLLCQSLNELITKITNIPESIPIYLSLDLDFFDPSIISGTGTPEPGGETFHSFIKIIKAFKSKNLVGADIVELAPMIDTTQNSSSVAAVVAREILLALTCK
ncbi:agmatinase [Bacteriovoracaceae bacterium]|nr:agmatinase [Bacteriovoracaceae bacterium]